MLFANYLKYNKQTLSELETLMSMEGSFKNYRMDLLSAVPPCLPYMYETFFTRSLSSVSNTLAFHRGVYLTDLTFIEDGNSDDLDGMINFSKRLLVHNIITTIQRYQQLSYNFSDIPEIQKWLAAQQPMPDQELYAKCHLSLSCMSTSVLLTSLSRSLEYEPRGAGRGDIV